MYRSHVLVCGGTGCTSSGSLQIMETLKAEIDKTAFRRRSVLSRQDVTASVRLVRS